MKLACVRAAGLLTLGLLVVGSTTALAQSPYYPPPGAWERKAPAQVGMDSALLAEAIEYAKSQETSKPMDYSDQERIFGRPLGPLPKRRAHTNGLVIRHGYIVAEFGETDKVDPTYSAAKELPLDDCWSGVRPGPVHRRAPSSRAARQGRWL